MNSTRGSCLAVDLGASSGRVMLVEFDGDRLHLQEVYRFPNGPLWVNGSLRWDFDQLIGEVRAGIAKGMSEAEGRGIDTIAVDSWGVDYGYLDFAGKLLHAPFHYRDGRTHGVFAAIDEAKKKLIYEHTGIQFLPFNTLYQLLADASATQERVSNAAQFVMMADLVANNLCGARSCEYTNASTTQLLDARTRNWCWPLIDEFSLPRGIFPKIVAPGTVLGELDGSISSAIGRRPFFVATASHDTASAVAAVPSTGEHFAYLSCGTWSLLGTELHEPLLTEEARLHNFTNEGGVGGRIRFLKNIMGLWLLQECRRGWNENGIGYSWADIEALCDEELGVASFIDVDEERFLPPGDMPQRVCELCDETGQARPVSDGAIVSCIVASLALRYRQTLDVLEELIGMPLPVLHIVGGGIQNRTLCQWTANATGRKVVAGPVEATALGNAGVQLLAAKKFASIEQMREAVGRSFSPKIYEAQNRDLWESAYRRYREVLSS